MGLIITKIKVIIISLFLFLILFSSLASALEDTTETYNTDWTEKYNTQVLTYDYSGNLRDNYWGTISVSKTSDPRFTSSSNTVLKVSSSSGQYVYWYLRVYAYLVPKENTTSPYFSFTSPGSGTSGSLKVGTVARILRASDNAVIAQFSPVIRSSYPSDLKIEIIKSGSYYDLYANGVLVQSVVNQIPSYSGEVKYCPGTYLDKTNDGGNVYTSWTYIDDLTDSSIIGTNLLYTESNTNITYTWASQLMRSYSTQQKINLYSLTNPSNAGLIKTWNIPQEDDSNTPEHGYLNFSRNGILGLNYGLYLLEMTRGEDILTNQYFYYDQISNPHGYPQILFLADSSVHANIRDDNQNGGEVEGGGSVYLFPEVQTDGTYNITYSILETPFAINTEIAKVYNNTALNGTDIHFNGLSSQNYKVSVDGEEIASTNGSDTWNYTITSWGSGSHVISFTPDYTLAGVWGEIKNSKTQKPIKSASVTVAGANNTTYLYTDDNGMYYLTKGMEAGKNYNLSVTKTGYAASNPAIVTTTEGKTTRTDFFLDPTSGEGVYYAPHSVTFTILENWYNYTGLPGVGYSVYDNQQEEEIKTGSTDSKGQFTVKEMDGGVNYTITLSYKGNNYTEYVEPGLSEYTFVLNKEGALHTYMNNWLTLSYAQNSTNATVTYSSNKTISGASLIATASNGTIAYTQTLTTQNGSFFFPFSPGDYSLQFHIKASDNSEASQVWTISNPATVNLFPTSYPAWLKNTLFTAIILIFLLAFGKSKNDIVCGSVAVLTSLGYFFKWLTCSFNFVVLVWIIAAGAIYLHYKRTGAVG